MPERYECSGCGLSVIAGWYDVSEWADGYGASTYFVCKHCGGQHLLKHALSEDDIEAIWSSAQRFTVTLTRLGPEKSELLSILREHLHVEPERIVELISNLPCMVRIAVEHDEATEIAESLRSAGAEVSVARVASSVDKDSIPRRENKLFWFPEGITSQSDTWISVPCEIAQGGSKTEKHADLDEQACLGCNKQGGLVSRMAELEKCAKCGATLVLTEG